MRLKDFVMQTAQRFDDARLCFAQGTDNALDEAVYLVYGLLGIDFAKSLDAADRELAAAEVERLHGAIVARIEQRRPVAYLVGQAWFAGLPFRCDPRALIPRSPLAELIGQGFAPLLKREPRRILDLGTGGGCIGIACAHYFPDSEVDLVDLSPDCLALAGENIVLHGLQQRVHTLQSNLFDAVTGAYDLIVANPPYVSREEHRELPAEFHHEPALALISERQGLELPLRILAQAADYLEEGGTLILEVGYSAPRLAECLPQVPLLWLQFERGGEGVAALTAAQLRQYSHCFN